MPFCLGLWCYWIRNRNPCRVDLVHVEIDSAPSVFLPSYYHRDVVGGIVVIGRLLDVVGVQLILHLLVKGCSAVGWNMSGLPGSNLWQAAGSDLDLDQRSIHGSQILGESVRVIGEDPVPVIQPPGVGVAASVGGGSIICCRWFSTDDIRRRFRGVGAGNIQCRVLLLAPKSFSSMKPRSIALRLQRSALAMSDMIHRLVCFACPVSLE